MKPDWITLDKTSGTEGVETVNISAMGNMGEERTSQIVAKTANGVQATLNIAQAGVPIVGAVRIYNDTSSIINGSEFMQNYGISYPVIYYITEGGSGTSSAAFSAEFNIDAKYIHDVVNYLADTYPNNGWDRDAPNLVIRWPTPLGEEDNTEYPKYIPETGRISFNPNPFVNLHIHDGSDIALSLKNSTESIYVDLYRIHFSDL